MTESAQMLVARQRIIPHLTKLVQRHAPDLDPDSAAGILLSADHPFRDTLIELLDDAIPKAASGHTPGVDASERNGWYSLGPGDQKVYAALRDSNLLNAAIGRQAVPSARHLVGGINYGVGADYAPAMIEPHGVDWIADQNRANRLIEAARYHQNGEADPAHHSTVVGTHYPAQHSFWNVENNGDTAVGQALSEMNAWPTASMRASRRDEPPLLKNDQPDLPFAPNAAVRAAGDLVNHGYKWGKNIVGGLIDSHIHEGVKTDAGRASVPVPEGLSPEKRTEYVNALQGLVEPTGAPSLQDYGHSKGVTYSEMEKFGNDFAHEFADPFTAASGAYGVVRGLGSGLLRAATSAAKRELIEEGSSPLNGLAVVATKPEMTWENFQRPDASTIPADAKEKYAAQQVERDQALQEAAKLRNQRDDSWLPRGAMIFPH
jgi:hypothetical protein